MEKSPDNGKFDAFGFNTDDEAVELVSGVHVGKFTSNPSTSVFLEPVPNESDFQSGHMDDIDAQANGISDDGDSSSLSSPSSSDVGENEGYLEDPASRSFSDGLQLQEAKDVVVVSPDYVTFKDKCCTESSLIFSSSGVTLEGTNIFGDKECFRSEWSICDVTHIESKWGGMVETALVKLRVRETAVVGDSRGPPDVEVNFAIFDDRWARKQEKILSLNAKYKAVWYEMTGSGRARLEGDHIGQNSTFSLERCLSDKHFEEVIYPKGDPDAVSISKRDVELLQPETFINDTLIDFYIKYLKNRIQPEDQHKFHFFNSFFFRKLADLDKDPSSAAKGRAAFLRVRKWTRKVNLFGKDYIFIPVNFNLHWSLIVLCHLGEVATTKGEETDDPRKIPCILHMDSIKGSHKGLENLIQSYLWEEWKERQAAESSEDLSSKFLNLRFINLELPQQENSFDCGLFLLHYVECFLEDAPNSFSPLNISKASNFLNIDWFPPSEASIKRARMKKLIQELVDDHSPVTPEVASSGGLTVLSGRSSLSGIGDSNSFLPTLEPGIEMNLLERSPTNDAQFGRDQGSVYREFFEPGSTAETFPHEQYPTFDQHSLPHTSKYVMSPIEEGEESQGGITSLSGAAGGWEPGELTFETCSTSYVSKNVGEAELCNLGSFSMHLEEHNDNSIPPASSFGYQHSSGIRFDVLSLTTDFASQNQQEQTEEANASQQNIYGSCPIDRANNFMVEGSQGMEGNTDVFENEDYVSCKDSFPAAMSGEEKNFLSEERNPPGVDDLQSDGDDARSGLNKDHHGVQLIEVDLESDEHNHIAKRPRLMLSRED